jgi:hypothetical protein
VLVGQLPMLYCCHISTIFPFEILKRSNPVISIGLLLARTPKVSFLENTDYHKYYHHHRHHTFSDYRNKMQKQGATKIMSDLDSALWKRITPIVQKENRSFSYLDSVPSSPWGSLYVRQETLLPWLVL